MSDMTQTGFERLTALSTVQTLTVPTLTTHGWLQAETNNVRIRFDGTDPANDAGLIIIAGAATPTELPVELLNNLEVIEESASAQLSVTYFGNQP